MNREGTGDQRWPSCCRKNAPTARSEKEKSIDAVSEAAIQRIVIASASARTTRGPALSGIPPLDHVQMAAIAPQTSDAITFLASAHAGWFVNIAA
jgi:hypothetical protein